MLTDLNKPLRSFQRSKPPTKKLRSASAVRMAGHSNTQLKLAIPPWLAKEAVGHGAFSIWRQQNLPHIPTSTATLYMRLAEHKDKFKEIANTVSDLSAKGELSLRRAAGLLPKRPQTAAQIAAANRKAEAKAAAKRSNEGMAKEYLEVLDVDELLVVLREVFDTDYLAKLAKALTPAQPSTQASASVGAGAGAAFDRRA
jgi:hypothetical protein